MAPGHCRLGLFAGRGRHVVYRLALAIARPALLGHRHREAYPFRQRGTFRFRRVRRLSRLQGFLNGCMMKFRQGSLAAVLVLINVVARAALVAPEETAQRDSWTAQAFKSAPFSFAYDGHASSNILGTWKRTA